MDGIVHIIRSAAAVAWIFGALWLMTTIGSALRLAWRDTHARAPASVPSAQTAATPTAPERDAA